MKLLLSGVAAVGLLGTAIFATVQRPDAVRAGQGDARPAVAAAQSEPAAFRLWNVGHETACTISRGAALPDGLYDIALSPGCADLPLLAGARYWRSGNDGTLALAAADGRTLLEFAESDGVAYETFRPGAPLIAMVAAD